MKFKIELELNDVRTAMNEWFANQGVEATFNVTGNNNQFSIHVTNATPIANKPKVIEAVEPVTKVEEPVEVNLVKAEEPKPEVIVEEEGEEETKEEETITGNIPSKSVVAELFK
jgi:hypothetical protein